MRKLAAVSALSISLAGIALADTPPTTTTSPTHTTTAATATVTTSTTKIGYDGYCPVAFQKMNQAYKGKPEFSTTYQGSTYYFGTAEAKKMFDASPTTYLAQFNGWDAYELATGKQVAGNPTIFWSNEGKTYFFSSTANRDAFGKNAANYLTMASSQWTKFSAMTASSEAMKSANTATKTAMDQATATMNAANDAMKAATTTTGMN
ncbi:hypothetical protein JNK13_04850 [bacterium]|nr:hypothetical protein [bacterium]